MNSFGALRADEKRGRLIAAPTRNLAVHAVGAAISRQVQELRNVYKATAGDCTRNTRNTRKGHAASVTLLRRERLRRGHATSVRLLCRQRLCRGYAASVTLVPRERLRYHGSGASQ